MKTSQRGINLIKDFEGCKLKAYRCSANKLTIGYGHTNNVRPDDVITKDEAETLLIMDLKGFESELSKLVKVPLNQNQFDALISWTFNLGSTNLKNSTLLKVLNDRHYCQVPYQILRWNKSGGKVLNGLIRRRKEEANLFAEPVEIKEKSESEDNMKFNEAFKIIVDAVKKVEEIKDQFKKSEEKKDYAVKLINDAVDIPYIPEFIEGKVIEILVDMTVYIFNQTGIFKQDEGIPFAESSET